MNARGHYGYGRSGQRWSGRPTFVGASDQVEAEYRAIALQTAPSAPPKPPAPVAIVRAVAETKKDSEAPGLFSIVKYAAIGALVVGGAVAVSSLVTTVKKGKEPVRYYADLYRDQQRGKRRAA